MKQTEKKTAKGILGVIYSKGVMVGAALVLLIAALVYFTTAWYTKMVSVTGMEFQAAQWEFTANQTIDTMNINVYEYATVTKDHAAPGTGGYIPLQLSAGNSQTAVDFSLTVDTSTMSEDFQKRISFYYKEGETKVYFKPTTEEYINGTANNEGAENKTFMTGRVPQGGTITVNIYWEWVYEAPGSFTPEQKLAWDEFDTRVGENPSLFEPDMNAELTIAGVEVEPQDPIT